MHVFMTGLMTGLHVHTRLMIQPVAATPHCYLDHFALFTVPAIYKIPRAKL